MINHFTRFFSNVLRLNLCKIKRNEISLRSSSFWAVKERSRFHTSQMDSVKREMNSDAGNHFVWMDMEMTGLEVMEDHILEIACLITDSKLNIIAEGPEIIVHQPDNVLQSMHAWCIEHHAKSGLTDASRRSIVSIEDAEKEILDFLRKFIPLGQCPLAGNSVYMDRIFLQRYLPQVNQYLHYRIIDVSSIKELCKRWNPGVYDKAPRKIVCHRALSDIKESIKELKYYQSSFFQT